MLIMLLESSTVVFIEPCGTEFLSIFVKVVCGSFRMAIELCCLNGALLLMFFHALKSKLELLC